MKHGFQEGKQENGKAGAGPESTPSTKVHTRKASTYLERIRSTASHTCDCGRPGVKYKRGGWNCADCLRIDDARERFQGEGKNSLHARRLATLNLELETLNSVSP